ncbi:cupin domain-containing protein [Vibrio mediterranei]|uniref:cupin domain-containing protein n=1 Tax=Vibrio mediterranei TaxID=689 RepID=UPI00181493C6|nr:cupin domain-containing protein [Vibrio mediterranei]NUW73826.1 cupin domain-containing protein [Vibrio mediterranei]
MEKSRIEDFVRGWFVGGFEPSLYKTTDVEIAVQRFNKGDLEASHCHKIATEITVIISGKAKMNGFILNEGDILSIEPGEYTDFEALEDTVTVVAKLPGALNDKYLKGE